MGDVIARHLEDGWENCLLEISENVGIAFQEMENTPNDLAAIKLPR